MDSPSQAILETRQLRHAHETTVAVAISILYSECVSVALVIHAILSSVASLAPTYFSRLSHKQHDFQSKLLCLFSLQF
jgi:hypothetical protein